MPTEADYLAEIEQARREVRRREAEWRRSILERNDLIREAKAAGVPALRCYAAAGIDAGTYSRQGGDSPSSS